MPWNNQKNAILGFTNTVLESLKLQHTPLTLSSQTPGNRTLLYDLSYVVTNLTWTPSM